MSKGIPNQYTGGFKQQLTSCMCPSAVFDGNFMLRKCKSYDIIS